MGSVAHLPIASTTTGALLQAVNPPESRSQVVVGKFELPSVEPLPGGTPLEEFVRELEADPDMAPRLANARKRLAQSIDEENALRKLRLAAGFSQAQLAERAETTQTYVARVEAATIDPGSDMIARLASALHVEDAVVFSAVRKLRLAKESRSA